jgi:hypothetical protein
MTAWQIVSVCLIAGLCASYLVAFGLYLKLRNVQRLNWQMRQFYDDNYPSLGGNLSEFGDYNLRSLDGGKHWYRVENRPDGGVIVIGEADPRLVERAQGLRKLGEFITRYGPLDPDNRLHLAIMEAAGITLTKADPGAKD